MKKLYSLFLFSLGLISTSYGQGQFEFYVHGDQSQTNYSGGTYQIHALGETDQYTKIDVVNKTGTDDSYVIGRRRLTPSAPSWTDFMCWGGSAGGGLCIDAPIMDQDYFQMQNSAVPLANDSMGLLESHIEPNFGDAGTYTYRYYVGTLNNYYIDSMDVEVTITPLSVPEPVLTIGIHPNPASEFVYVQADGYETAEIKVVDVLGNNVLTTTVSGTTKIDVSEFRNGIYFVTVSAEGNHVSRKVIVRH